MRFTLYKMQACGNDFLFFDSMHHEPPMFYQQEIRWLCDRHFGVGADGLVVLASGKNTHAQWTFYNSDGSEAEMCGNAARCAILFLQIKYFPNHTPISILTAAGIVRGRCLDPRIVELALFDLKEEGHEVNHKVVPVGEQNFEVYSVNTGVPHAVIEVKDILTYPIEEVGKKLVHHPAFGSKGTNVTFFQRLVGNRIRTTTFERGVEKETFACGTGVAAAAIAYSQNYLQPFPIEVLAPGGDLIVDSSPVSQMLLITGPAEFVFEINVEDIPRNFEKPFLYSESKGTEDAR